MAPPIVPGGSVDPQTQLKTYEAYVRLIADPNGKDESKLQAAQELSENFEVIPYFFEFILLLLSNFDLFITRSIFISDHLRIFRVSEFFGCRHKSIPKGSPGRRTSFHH